MLTKSLQSRADALWTAFWSGGITNPLTAIEQITFLIFSRLLDATETENERKFQVSGKDFIRLFTPDQQNLRWSQYQHLEAPAMLSLVRDRVFPHLKTIVAEETPFGRYMKDAQLTIQKPTLLASAVKMISALPLDQADIKGDLYEFFLGKLTTAKINGQFRTPCHITRLMVEILEPKPTETVGDPACGTAGFLVTVAQYLLETYTSPDGVITNHDTGHKTFTGDQLEPHRDHIRHNMFHGFDLDSTMLRIAAMNLMLHGIDAPHIFYQDTLAKSFPDHFPDHAANKLDVILANPPFKGHLNYEDVHLSLTSIVKTRKTELLFLALILQMLKPGGRSATIVPDGVLFGSSKAHRTLRKTLIEENQLHAVISLPSGVFKPYAGVSTAILVFTKGGYTEHVFFYNVQADGFSLNNKRNPVKDNDLPNVLQRWRTRDPTKDTDRTDRSFCVPSHEIRSNQYDLSLNRYKKMMHAEEEYDSPQVILQQMQALNQEIAQDMADLEEMLVDNNLLQTDTAA